MPCVVFSQMNAIILNHLRKTKHFPTFGCKNSKPHRHFDHYQRCYSWTNFKCCCIRPEVYSLVLSDVRTNSNCGISIVSIINVIRIGNCWWNSNFLGPVNYVLPWGLSVINFGQYDFILLQISPIHSST